MKLALILSLLALAGPAKAGARCPPLTYDELKAKLAGRGRVQIIFFASWCGECKSHLAKANPEQSILIATFDEPLAAERLIAAREIRVPCYTDAGIAERLKVTAVPHVLDWKD